MVSLSPIITSPCRCYRYFLYKMLELGFLKNSFKIKYWHIYLIKIIKPSREQQKNIIIFEYTSGNIILRAIQISQLIRL